MSSDHPYPADRPTTPGPVAATPSSPVTPAAAPAPAAPVGAAPAPGTTQPAPPTTPVAPSGQAAGSAETDVRVVEVEVDVEVDEMAVLDQLEADLTAVEQAITTLDTISSDGVGGEQAAAQIAAAVSAERFGGAATD